MLGLLDTSEIADNGPHYIQHAILRFFTNIYPLLLGWQLTKSNPCKPCSENIYNSRNYTKKYFWEHSRILEITQTAGIK